MSEVRKMAKWEYEIMETNSKNGADYIKSHLNNKGKDGWELVFITTTKDVTSAYFKREVK
jgi:hypothetical protein